MESGWALTILPRAQDVEMSKTRVCIATNSPGLQRLQVFPVPSFSGLLKMALGSLGMIEPVLGTSVNAFSGTA